MTIFAEAVERAFCLPEMRLVASNGRDVGQLKSGTIFEVVGKPLPVNTIALSAGAASRPRRSL